MRAVGAVCPKDAIILAYHPYPVGVGVDQSLQQLFGICQIRQGSLELISHVVEASRHSGNFIHSMAVGSFGQVPARDALCRPPKRVRPIDHDFPKRDPQTDLKR